MNIHKQIEPKSCIAAYLCSKILQDSSKVHGSSRTNAFGVSAFLQVTSKPPDGELKTSFDGLGDSLLLGDLTTASLAAAFRHGIHGESLLQRRPKETIATEVRRQKEGKSTRACACGTARASMASLTAVFICAGTGGKKWGSNFFEF
jgi:hypothetical protein